MISLSATFVHHDTVTLLDVMLATNGSVTGSGGTTASAHGVGAGVRWFSQWCSRHRSSPTSSDQVSAVAIQASPMVTGTVSDAFWMQFTFTTSPTGALVAGDQITVSTSTSLVFVAICFFFA